MRTLAFYCAINILLFLPSALASAPNIKLSSSLRAEEGQTGLSTSRNTKASSVISKIDVNSGSRFGPLSVRMGLDRKLADYSRNLITDRQGRSTVLSDRFNGPEYLVRVGADLYMQNFSAILDAGKTVADTPFPGYFLGISPSYEHYPTGSKFTLKLTRSDFRSPTSYFIHPDNFRTLERPSRTLENRVVGQLDQIFSESLKARLELTYVDRSKDRPNRNGAQIVGAWAFSETLALLLTGGGVRERRRDPLLDDRGYLDAYWAQSELRYEPNYKWSFSLLTGTLLETETARGSLRRQKVGTDSLGVATTTKQPSFEAGLRAIGSLANTNYKTFQIGGEFAWLF